MAYNSAYKGSEIDAAVSAVRQKESTWDDKQDALTGTSGQFVGFNAQGEPEAKGISAGNVTFSDGETFQQKYDSGELKGPPGADGATGPAGADGAPGAAGKDATINGVNALTLEATNGITSTQNGNTLTLDGSGLMPTSVNFTLTAAGWDSTTKKQTVTVPGVLADGTKQFVTPYAADADSLYAWGNAGLRCFEWAANSLTFECDTIPAADINLFAKLEPRKG